MFSSEIKDTQDGPPSGTEVITKTSTHRAKQLANSHHSSLARAKRSVGFDIESGVHVIEILPLPGRLLREDHKIQLAKLKSLKGKTPSHKATGACARGFMDFRLQHADLHKLIPSSCGANKIPLFCGLISWFDLVHLFSIHSEQK